MAMLSKNQVIERTSLSAVTIWRRVRAGDFPQSVQLSPGRVGWIESEVTEWLESRQRGIAELPANFKKGSEMAKGSKVNNKFNRSKNYGKTNSQ